jgi:hypothetical protein
MTETNQHIVQEAQQFIAQGQLDRAFEVLLPLKSKSISVLQSNYASVRQCEIKNMISFEDAQREYNKITDGLLSALEHDEQASLGFDPNKKRLLIIAVGVLTVIAALVFWFTRSSGNKSSEKGKDCPVYTSTNKTKILIFPFINIGEKSDAKPAIAVMQGIAAKTMNRNLPVEVKIQETNELLTPDLAKERGNSCGVDLVIHGSFAAFQGDSIGIRLNYAFVKGTQKDGSSGIITVPNVMAMENLRSVEDVVLSICAQIAMEQNKPEVAKAWLENIKQTDDRTEESIRRKVGAFFKERIKERIQERKEEKMLARPQTGQ